MLSWTTMFRMEVCMLSTDFLKIQLMLNDFKKKIAEW